MLQFLKPVAEKHSISRAVASVIIPQNFLKPTDVLDKIKEEKRFQEYPKKVLTKGTTIKLNPNSFDISNEKVNGFIFENYDEKGGVREIFRLENNNENQSTLSIETRKYEDWDSFKRRIDENLKSFLDTLDFYVSAINLNFRDEFIWLDNSAIDVKSIFNIESELLNKKFLTSRNGTFVLITQGAIEQGGSYEERTEISFNNDIRRIVLDHQYATRFEDIRLFNKVSSGFSNLYDKAHSENKEILKDTLTLECQRKINLK